MEQNRFYYKDGSISNDIDDSKFLHKLDGPAMEYANGDRRWLVDGKLHRLDGPAIEYANGSKEWYVDDKHHRAFGAATEFANGNKYWYVDNKKYTEEEFNDLMKEVRSLPLAIRLTDPREWVREVI